MTTHQSTIRPVPHGAGWAPMGAAPAAVHGDGEQSGRDRRVGRAGDGVAGDVVAVIVHLSDIHVCDAESPARLEYLQPFGMVGAPFARLLGDIGTYRPQELLTVPVALAMVDTVNRLAGGPVTGAPLDAAVLTGDLVDNAQANELDWYLTVVEGGSVRPTSGDPDACGWVGAPTAEWSSGFWHPEGHPAGIDQWCGHHGFPTLPDLLGHARAPVTSPGLQLPFFGVHGNHDLLLQGTVPVDADLCDLAIGDRRIAGLAPGRTPLIALEAIARIGPARYPHIGAGTSPTTEVPPDPARRPVTPTEFVQRHDAIGDGAVMRGPARAFTAVVNDEVRLVALDTVNPFGGWEGSIDRDQLAWLRRTFADATEPYLVVASHHPSWCLVNGYSSVPWFGGRVLAEEVVGVLLDEPRVIAWIAGHVHRHELVMHRRDGRVLPEITAASLIDWPQQSRVLEIVREPGGALALVSTAIDHRSPAIADTTRWDDPLHLAAVSRQIAAGAALAMGARGIGDSPEERPPGKSVERNVIVRVPDPL
jgi:metallophosphoesterase (TIGR03767 family)